MMIMMMASTAPPNPRNGVAQKIIDLQKTVFRSFGEHEIATVSNCLCLYHYLWKQTLTQ